MRTDTKEKKAKTVNRQIEFPSKIYTAADDFASDENKRLRNSPNHKRLFIKDILPLLVAFGLKFVKGEVYTPDDAKAELIKDKKWAELRARAELACEEFNAYQKELLEKEEE
jgi:hypothetical protein